MPPHFGDFIEAIGASQDIAAAKIVLQRTIETLGFTQFDYGSGSLLKAQPTTAGDLRLDLHLSTRDWAAYYTEQNYQTVDRSILRSITQSTPWVYQDLFSTTPSHKLQRQMEGEVIALVSSGLALPMHSAGKIGVLHLGSDLPASEFARLDHEYRPLVALVGAYFHAHLVGLVGAKQPVRLSARERECLQWASAGKTSWEISVILSLSESTVRDHIGSALHKLNVRTRAQAVAKAMSLGLIAL